MTGIDFIPTGSSCVPIAGGVMCGVTTAKVRIRSDPWRDETAVHHCPHPDHAELGVHLHEVEPGRWRLFDTTKETP